MLDVAQVSKAQVIDFVSEIQMLAGHHQSSYCLRIMVATDVEVSRDLVDENEATHLASFSIIKGLLGVLDDLVGLEPVFLRVPEGCFAFNSRINSNMPLVVDVLVDSQFSPVLVESVLLELSLDVNEVHAGDIDDIERENVAWTVRQRDVQVDV